MKVLFAVSSENISEAIIKRYQKEYKEILSYKNVYYFNAILKEIQKDKTYDRIIISEDLEPFSNNNYDTIDKFIFEKLDSISDEAQDSSGKETSIILICTDRRQKGNSILVKLFGIGVYNALLGNDRSMEEVCRLINKPRTKKEAKMYYRIDTDDVNYKAENENEVSEVEIQNILAHFKKLGKNTAKYSDSFNNIAVQYNDEQLKIIVNCLPINVKAVLESNCERYQELLATTGGIRSVKGMAETTGNIENAVKSGLNARNIGQAGNITKPIVIPSAVRNANNQSQVVRKPAAPAQPGQVLRPAVQAKPQPPVTPAPAEEDDELLPGIDDIDDLDDIIDDEFIADTNMQVEEEPEIAEPVEEVQAPVEPQVQRPISAMPQTGTFQRPRRPVPGASRVMPSPVAQPVAPAPAEEEDDLLPGFEDEEVEEVEDNSAVLPGFEEEPEEDLNINLEGLPGLDDDELVDSNTLPGLEDNEEVIDEDTLPGLEDEEEIVDEDVLPGIDDTLPEVEEDATLKRGRGRPRKTPVEGAVIKPKGKRGRPRKYQEVDEVEDETSELLPGMEYEDDNVVYDEPAEDTMLPGFDEEEVVEDTALPEEYESDEATMLPGMGFEDEESVEDEAYDEVYEEVPEDATETTEATLPQEEVAEDEYTDEVALPGLDALDDYEDDTLDEYESEEDDLLPGIGEDNYSDEVASESVVEDNTDDSIPTIDQDLIPEYDETEDNGLLPGMGSYEEEPIMQSSNNSNVVESIKPRVDYSMSSLNSLITKDKKIVTFIGTSKNGVSFLVNNLAALFSSLGINTAVLDMTKNKNSYYIYTKNEEELRNIAFNSIEKLQNGYAEGIKVDKNLTVYTALPNDGKDYSNAEPILSTLVQNHSLVLIDCDYDTDLTYFASCQEMYLVQSMDILTIQPLTAFLRELKTKGILEPEKIRVVINKELKVRSLSIKAIIGGLSYYNDPAMSFMTELFNKDMVKACTIPFEDNAYSKYLEGIVNCNISLNGFSKAFLSKLKVLGDMVYPLTSKQTYGKGGQMPNYNQNAFSSSMNDTLNKMKKQY